MSSEKVSVVEPRAVSRDIFSATLGSIACCYTGQVCKNQTQSTQDHSAETMSTYIF
jgi:hypothetical protein